MAPLVTPLAPDHSPEVRLNRWNDSMGTTLEDGAAATGDKHLAATGWSRGKHV